MLLGGTSETLKAKISGSSPKKVINKFFYKHFRIIAFIFPINSTNKCYWYMKTLKALFCVESFSINFTIKHYFFMFLIFSKIFNHLSKRFPSFIIKYIRLVLSEYLLYILIYAKNMHKGLIFYYFYNQWNI